MPRKQRTSSDQFQPSKKNVALGVWATFIVSFVGTFYMGSVNIVQPIQVADLNGMALFSWMIALPSLGSAVASLMFGKLSDMFGRRLILLTSLTLFLVGNFLSAMSNTIGLAIGARVIVMLGWGALNPLCFSVIGDLFDSSARARWSGMFNIPSGIAATIAPTLGGLITEGAFGWRGLFWIMVPLILVSGGLVAIGIPGQTQKTEQKVDFLGIFVMVIASAALIIGVSWLGDPSKRVFGFILAIVSFVAWRIFISIEKKTEVPILDPKVLYNRIIITVASAGFMSYFGLIGVMIYSPIFVQEVMDVSPAVSGSMLTPFSMLFTFMGVPAGFLLAKTKKSNWMIISGYTLLSVAMFIMWQFTSETPVWLFILITALVGLGVGIMPTINILVAQFSVPKQLLGAASGALFFVYMMGRAIAPAILGLAQNSAPDLEAGLKLIFLIGAIAMVVSLIIALTIPDVKIIDSEEDDK
jgi:MFS family permease